jgi:hypothetical protein
MALHVTRLSQGQHGNGPEMHTPCTAIGGLGTLRRQLLSPTLLMS